MDQIVANEKNYVRQTFQNPGGNGVNVARMLTRMGVPAVASGFMGGGIGSEIKTLLDNEKVSHQFISIRNQSRINITITETRSNLQTRLSFPGPRVQGDERKKLEYFVSQIRSGSIVMIGGSFPPGFSIHDFLNILKICRQRKIMTIVDCPGSILEKAVSMGPLLIKPNLLEFNDLVGRNLRTISAVVKEARKLTSRIPLVCVSSVEGGALLIHSDTAWFGRVPKIHIKSTVGAGDSMVGAMIAEIYKAKMTSPSIEMDSNFLRRIMPKILKMGLAASAASLSREGTSLGSKRDIQRYYSKISVTEL